MPRLVRFSKMKTAALKRVVGSAGRKGFPGVKGAGQQVAGAKPNASAVGVSLTKPSVPKPPKPYQSRGVL